MPIPPPPRRLRELDGLRGLAALAVAPYHYTWFVRFILPGTALPAVQVTWGCDGVKLFFSISAFAIVVTLERTRNLAQFAGARARRLLPEYWVAMVLTGGVAWALGPTRLQVDPLVWLANLPLLQTWTGSPMVDGVYWTLNVEILFYALIALAWRAGLTRRIDRLVLGWMALRVTCWLLPVPAWVQQVLLIEHAPCFAIGLIAGRHWLGRGLGRGLGRAPGGEALALTVAVVAVTALTGDSRTTLLTAGIAALFAVVVDNRAAWLAHPALLWLGAISYPFYLLHAVIGYAIIARLQAMGMNAGGAALVALASTVALAAVVAHGADRWRRPAPAPALYPAMA